MCFLSFITQRRLDLDGHKKYERDLVWAWDVHQSLLCFLCLCSTLTHCEFAFGRYNSSEVNINPRRLPECDSVKIIGCKPASPEAENSRGSDLILIANLPHASIASVLCSRHDTVHDKCFAAQHDGEPETKQLFTEGFRLRESEPWSLREQTVFLRSQPWSGFTDNKTSVKRCSKYEKSRPSLAGCRRGSETSISGRLFNNRVGRVLWLALSWWISFSTRWYQAARADERKSDTSTKRCLLSMLISSRIIIW